MFFSVFIYIRSPQKQGISEYFLPKEKPRIQYILTLYRAYVRVKPFSMGHASQNFENNALRIIVTTTSGQLPNQPDQ